MHTSKQCQGKKSAMHELQLVHLHGTPSPYFDARSAIKDSCLSLLEFGRRAPCMQVSCVRKKHLSPFVHGGHNIFKSRW